MRGEKTDSPRGRAVAAGSSPHARGKDSEGPHQTDQSRIIPACAGKSFFG